MIRLNRRRRLMVTVSHRPMTQWRDRVTNAHEYDYGDWTGSARQTTTWMLA